MVWRTDKPTEKVIVAKLKEDFCHLKDGYAILRLANEPYQHYCEDGEEIPYAAIEKWASLEVDLEKEVEHHNPAEYFRKDTILSLLNQKRCSYSGMPPTQFFQGEMCGLQEAIQIVKDL